MVTPELLDFVRTQIASGVLHSEIRKLLLADGGWTDEDVDEAFRAVAPSPVAPPTPVAQPTPPVQSEKRIEQGPVAVPPVEKSPLDALLREEARAKLLAEEQAKAQMSAVAEQLHEVSSPVGTQNVAPSPVPPPVVTVAPPSSPPAPVFPAILPGEDFLGIFVAPEHGTSSSEVISPATNVSSEKNVDIRVVSATSAPHISHEYLSPQAKISTPIPAPATPAIVTPPQPLNVNEAKPSLAGMPTTRFNLEKVRGEGGISVEHGRESKESNFSEVLAHKFSDHAPQGGVAQAPEGSVATARGAVLGRRTMASDILLHGMSSTPVASPPPEKVVLAGRPLNATVPPPLPITTPATPIMPVTSSEVSAPKVLPALPHDEEVDKNKTKRVMGMIIGGLLLVAILGGIAFAVMKYLGMGSSERIYSALSGFLDSTSFSYDSDTRVDLVITDIAKIEKPPTNVTFSLASKGSLNGGASGYGDGVHHVKLDGKMQTGNVILPTTITPDITITGSSLFFHLLNIPEKSELDPELFEKYWIKIDLSEIAKELTLSGVLGVGADYGDFGDKNDPESAFANLMKTHAPFVLEGGAFESEVPDGLEYMRFRVDPDKGLSIVLALYRKYMGKELVMSDDERIRLKDAIAKFGGEVGIDKKTSELKKIVLRANLDDIILDSEVKGTVSTTFTFSDLNVPVNVTEPTSVLTLEELKVEMEKYKTQKTLILEDRKKIEALGKIISALGDYLRSKGRYPSQLKDLYTENTLATTTIPVTSIGEYFYATYVGDQSFTRSDRCTPSGKVCRFYHLGVNLASGDATLLEKDADKNTDVRGSDLAGCAGEKGVVCYDVVSEKFQEPTATTSTTTAPKR